MTEISRPWAGTTVGDAGPYTAQHWWDVWQAMQAGSGALCGAGNAGVFASVPGCLSVTYSSPNTLHVDAGAAMLDGLYYRSDYTASIHVTSASAGNVRNDRVVVRKQFGGAQTARLALLTGSEAASPGPGTPPAIVQDTLRQTYWDIPLAQISITELGVITVTDERGYADAYYKRALVPVFKVMDVSRAPVFDPDTIAHSYAWLLNGVERIMMGVTWFPSDLAVGDVGVKAVIMSDISPLSGNALFAYGMSRRPGLSGGVGYSTYAGGYVGYPIANAPGITNTYHVTIGEMISSLGAGPGDIVSFEFHRDAFNPVDTCEGALEFYGWLLSYWARK